MLCIRKFCHDFDILARHCVYLSMPISVCIMAYFFNAYMNEYTIVCNEWNC